MSTMLVSTALLTLLSIATAIMAFFVHAPAPGIAVALFLIFFFLLLVNVFFDWREYAHPTHRL